MNDRLTVDTITSDQLDALYDRIATLEHVAPGNKRHPTWSAHRRPSPAGTPSRTGGTTRSQSTSPTPVLSSPHSAPPLDARPRPLAPSTPSTTSGKRSYPRPP
ncbi:hypothetical protein [Streptomyces sp. NBC_01092]|uniref:hypothetical protein n=1 Tax=Streptomyces sp. NBC_01092 TaxID=2903748 RepID=UPI00386AEE26|nr:hypothetical protein OG254_08575 [Streptomyces sp. NBC_01092]